METKMVQIMEANIRIVKVTLSICVTLSRIKNNNILLMVVIKSREKLIKLV